MATMRLPQRPMTFTGCWTCKARKIRCDETPVSCKNCEKRGVSCGGYGIRLQWVSDPFSQPEKQPGRSGGRRSIKLDEQSGQRYRLKDIDTFLGAIDDGAAPRQSMSQGPFSVFPARDGEEGLVGEDALAGPSGMADNNREGRQDWDYDEFADDLNLNHTSYLTSPLAEPGHGRNAEWPSAHEESLPLHGATSAVDYLDDAEFDIGESPGHSTEMVMFRQSDGQIPHDQAAQLGSELIRRQSITRLPRLSLSGDVEIDSLINHYMTHVSEILQPIRHPQNQYRSRGLFLTSALQGAVENILDPKASNPTIYSTLYHAVLASAAFHLWNRNKVCGRYKTLGVTHQQNALSSLRFAVQSPTSGADYKTLMMAMLSLVTIGVVSGDGEDFQVHLGAASQLRSSRNGWRLVSSQTRQVNEISLFLSILARTLAFQPPPTTWSLREREVLDGEMAMIQSNTCFEYMYGITPELAGAILEMCRLAEYLSEFTAAAPIPDDLLEACEALGERLVSWRFGSEHVALMEANDACISAIFYHQAHAWHHAALLYYYRRIQGWATDLGQEIGRAMEHMHAAEEAKTMPGAPREGVMAPLTWPATIASLDAVGAQRDVCRRWWERVLSYGLANIDRQWEAVQQVWQRVDELGCQGSTPDGFTVFRDMGLRVLPV